MPEPTPTARSQADARQGEGSKTRSRFWRVGCGLFLPLWFMLLMLPCALLFLAVNGEIRIWHDSVPDPYAQPRLLISLISEVDDRGIRIESSSVFDPDADTLSTCVETKVRFLLWQSKAGNQDVTYCECYRRTDEQSAWTWQRSLENSCPVTE